MPTVGLTEAKSKLSELLDQVEQGEEIVISREGRAVARIVAVAQPGTVDRSAFLGSLAGRIHVTEDFDAPLPRDVQHSFEGYDDETSSR